MKTEVLERAQASEEFLAMFARELDKPGSLEAIIANGKNVKVTTHAVVRNELGEIVDESITHNTVTTPGKNGIADQILASPTLGKPTHMAIGTGSPSGTALGTELDRNALTSKTRSGAVVTFVGDWAAGDGTGTLTEAGLFDASSSGNMWLSTTLAVTKGALDTLTITWTLTIS